MRPAMIAFVVSLPLLACGGPAPPFTDLPPDAVVGAGDPTRAAIVYTAYVFNTPASLARRPADAARAAAQVEHLATEIPYGPRWFEFSPLVGRELVAARGRKPPSRLQHLTGRERDILHEMAQGRSNAAIAGRLGLSERAVEKHSNSISPSCT